MIVTINGRGVPLHATRLDYKFVAQLAGADPRDLPAIRYRASDAADWLALPPYGTTPALADGMVFDVAPRATTIPEAES